MSDFTDHVTDDHAAFIAKQPVFFIATAAAEVRINLSPKGMDSFRVLGPKRVGYLDVSGSGNETHAHLAADGRATIMFCAFERPALILRIYARGCAVLPQDDGWDALVPHFTMLPGTRQIFEFAIDSVQTSCGWGVPLMSFERESQTLKKFAQNYSDAELLDYQRNRTRSIDGLPVRLQDRVPH
jgi:Pyridoxamine 5'-phosphate oxidase